MVIYGFEKQNRYVFFTGDLVVVVIESRELADMQKALFENLWERC